MSAAATLGLLARCVALVPHDRLETERRRERSDFALLSGPLAVFPPILTVALLGLQLTFWQHATNFTGESFELLLFAGIIWQLLEYRLDEAPRRLYLAAFACGAGIAEHWAFFGYFPLFLAAVIWLRGLDFFHSRFLARLLWSGLGGAAILFLLPLAVAISGKYYINFLGGLSPRAGNALVSLPFAAGTGGVASTGHGLGGHFAPHCWFCRFAGVLISGETSGTGKGLLNFLFHVSYFGFWGCVPG